MRYFIGQYCEKGKTLRKEIISSISHIKSIESNFNTQELIKYIIELLETSELYDKEFLKTILEKLDLLDDIDFHRSIAERQRQSYNQMKKNLKLLENSIIIEVKSL